MPRIDLANVNISLQQFQSISSGKYNAGEVKLTGQNSIGKVNNHVTLGGKNNVKIAHEEVLAVKQAFVKALARGGVGSIEISKVRAELGLAPMGAVDTDLKDRSVRPLSRQQIRSILDRNAEAINAAEGEGTIRTSDEIYARVPDRRKTDRAATRDAVNASLDARRDIDANATIEHIQAVISGDVEYRTEEERRDILKFAEQQLDSLRVACRDRPSDAKPAQSAIVMPSGQRVVMDTGKSEAEFIHMLEDMILRLKCNPKGAGGRTLAVCGEFKALGTDAERKAWAASLPRDSAGACKARTVTVMLMYERGILDAETLGIPNGLNDDGAREFLARLLDEAPELKGDALRDSQSVRSARANVHPPAPREVRAKAYLPVYTAAEYNEAIARGFDDSRDLLPASFRSLAEEIGLELRNRFGERGYKDNPKYFRALFSRHVAQTVINAAAGEGNYITPATLRATLMDEAVVTSSMRFVRNTVEASLPEADRELLGVTVANALMIRRPEVKERLAASESLRQSEAILHEYAADIAECTRLARICNTAQEGVAGKMLALLAEKMGVPAESLESVGMDTSRLENKALRLAESILNGVKNITEDAQIEEAFGNLANDYAEAYMTALGKIDTLDVPPAAKDALRELVLNAENPALLDVTRIVDSAKAIQTDALEARLDAKASVDQIVSALDEISVKSGDLARDYFAEDVRNGKEIGPGERATVRQLVLAIVAHAKPALGAKLVAFLSRPDLQKTHGVKGAVGSLRFLLPEPGANEALASKLGKNDLPPLAMQALLNAVRIEGLDMLSRDEALALFAEGQPVGDLLRSSLRDMADAAGPSALEILARGFIRSSKNKIIAAHLEAQQIRAAEREFLQGEGAQRALAAGYARAELPHLARIAAFHQVATGCSPADAATAVLDPQSKTRRVYQYGGRFTGSVANFRSGLALIDKFADWYQKLCADINAKKKDTPTLLNAFGPKVNPRSLRAYEKFLFEEVAFNKAIDIDGQNPESIFGMEANAAMRFIGRNYSQAFTNSLAQIPPEMRQLVYAVFDAIDPLMRSQADEANHNPVGPNVTLAVRVMKNFDAVDALRRAGTLDRAHIISTLFPEFDIPANATTGQFNNAYDSVMLQLVDQGILGPVQLLMELTGASRDECVDAVQHGREIPPAPYVTTFSGELSELDGTAQGGRDTLVGDLIRASIPHFTANNAPALAAENACFTIFFPGEAEPMRSKNGLMGNPAVSGPANAIADKLEALCGKVHQAQLSAVYFALSQSGLGGVINNAFLAHGVKTDEHSPATCTLAKDAETGAVTIRYSEPEGFPIHFSWETTIQTDGSSTSTPLVIHAGA